MMKDWNVMRAEMPDTVLSTIPSQTGPNSSCRECVGMKAEEARTKQNQSHEY